VKDETLRIHQTNATAWDQTSDWYGQRADELATQLSNRGSTLHDQEQRLLAMLPPLETWCETAVHLQCAAGFDTISLTNLGALSAVGVDISPELIGVADALAQRTGAPVTFQCADVLTMKGIEGTADLVYTGKGAVHWMFDLEAWAGKIMETLKPGGWFLLFDFHPMMWLFRDSDQGLEINPVSYFAPVIRYTEWGRQHFSGSDPVDSAGTSPKQLRPWPPSAVIEALLGAGLEIKLFHEYPDTLAEGWTAYPGSPRDERARIATTYSVMARKREG
jgi:SAM-dependent methyltransferase